MQRDEKAEPKTQCEPTSVFVYGTLQRGQVRERCWPCSPIGVEKAYVRGRLFDLGPYPALVEGDDWVQGELWRFLPQQIGETLRVLDEIEGYQQGDDDLYVRQIVACRTEDGREECAFVYFFAQPQLLQRARQIEPDGRGVCRWPDHRAS